MCTDPDSCGEAEWLFESGRLGYEWLIDNLCQECRAAEVGA